MIEGVVQFTEQEKEAIVAKRKQRHAYYAKNGQWRRKVDKAVYKIYNMAASRFERLLREKMWLSGYTKEEAEFILRTKHFEQVPLKESEEI